MWKQIIAVYDIILDFPKASGDKIWIEAFECIDGLNHYYELTSDGLHNFLAKTITIQL